MASTRERLLTGAIWITFGRIIANALGFLSTIVLARLLMPDDFGVVAICTALIMILSAVVEMPLDQALVQHAAPQESHYHTAFSMSVLRSLLLAALIVLSASPITDFYGDPRLRNILFVLAASSFVDGFVNPKLATFSRELVFRQIFALEVSQKLAGFLVVITVALIFHSYWALVLALVASQVTRVVISYVLKPFRPRFTFVHAREILSFSIWITFATWLQALNWRASPLVYGAVLPTALLGQYSLGNRLTGVIVGQLVQPLQQTLFPAFSRFQSQQEELRRIYVRAQGVICLWIFPFALSLVVLAPDLVRLVLGRKWIDAGPVIQILALTSAFMSIEALQPLAMATGNTRQLFYVDLRAFLVRWPLVLFGMFIGWSSGSYGVLIGGMIGSWASSLVDVVWNMTLVRKIIGLSLREQGAFALRPAISVAVMAGGVWFLGQAWSTPVNPWFEALRLIALFLCGLLLYGAMLALLWWGSGRPRGAEVEILEILQQFVRKNVCGG